MPEPDLYAVEVVVRETATVQVRASSKAEAHAKARALELAWEPGVEAIYHWSDREVTAVHRAWIEEP